MNLLFSFPKASSNDKACCLVFITTVVPLFKLLRWNAQVPREDDELIEQQGLDDTRLLPPATRRCDASTQKHWFDPSPLLRLHEVVVLPFVFV